MKKNKWLILMILLIPLMVFAKESDASMIPFAYMWEAFCSLHVYYMVIKPLSNLLINKGHSEWKAWKLMVIRILFLLVVTPIFPNIFLVEFFAMFILAFIMGISTTANVFKGEVIMNNTTDGNVICPKCKIVNKPTSLYCAECGAALVRGAGTVTEPLKCPKCSAVLIENAKFCKYCGENVEKITAKVDEQIPFSAAGKPVDKSVFDPALINGSEDSAILSIIKKELSKNPDSHGKTLSVLEKRKKIMTVIYAVILFIIISIFMFYHTYGGLFLLIGIVGTIIFISVLSKFNIEKYLVKETKKRPDEKISYIVSSVLQGTREKNIIDRVVPIGLVLLVIGACLYLYSEPHMIFEKQSDGYAVRYYTYGIFKNDKIIKVPSKHNGMNVIGIRGDTFKNVYTVYEVVLPSTIKEIRGGAFQNCTNLESINLPEGIDEIHGSTFEGCSNLRSIIIPKGVTRIGGSAFRDCYNLSEVTIPVSVGEIGSSAFRNTKINKVCISNSTYVNERAFKNTYPDIVYYEDGCESSNDDTWSDYYYES